MKRDAAVRLLRSAFEAAVAFDMRLPELFCGFPRVPGGAPVAYPVACLPQAWAAGSAFMSLQACLGLRIDGPAAELVLDHPRLPAGVEELSIRNIPLGERRAHLVLKRVAELPIEERKRYGALVNRLKGQFEAAFAERREALAVDRRRQEDEGRDHRQVGIVDLDGGAATYTGPSCLDWAGGLTGDGFAVQGNILTGPEVVEAMRDAFEASDIAAPLARRLLDALAAGDAAGGDSRGRQSAALLVVKEEGRRRRLTGIVATGRGIPRPGMSVSLTPHVPLGDVTSGTFSPTLRKGIGLVYVPADIEDGVEVAVDVRGRREIFTLTKPPFVDTSVRES